MVLIFLRSNNPRNVRASSARPHFQGIKLIIYKILSKTFEVLRAPNERPYIVYIRASKDYLLKTHYPVTFVICFRNIIVMCS